MKAKDTLLSTRALKLKRAIAKKLASKEAA